MLAAIVDSCDSGIRQIYVLIDHTTIRCTSVYSTRALQTNRRYLLNNFMRRQEKSAQFETVIFVNPNYAFLRLIRQNGL